jgi:hypothetical protein
MGLNGRAVQTHATCCLSERYWSLPPGSIRGI